MEGPSVSQKWLLGILSSILIMGAAGWMTHVHSQLNTMAEDQIKQREREQTTVKDTAVIKEKVERLEQDIREIKQDQREHSKKLDELLRRVR